MKKTLRKVLPVLALVLVVAVASVGGTIAWLTANTDPVVNTFTVGNINIALTETPNTDTNDDGTADAWKAKLIPNSEYTKNPVVSVASGSEDCYLFVKFEKTANLDSYLEYTSTLTSANGWTQLEGHSTVWYRQVAMTDTTRSWNLLEGDKVTVKDLTKDTMATTDLTMKYTAAAIQSANIVNAADAWSKLPTEFTTGA